MIVAIHQPEFLPYLGFFNKVSRADLLVLLDDVQFLERGFQHRNVIKMQAGTQWLTVPVAQRRGQLIREVLIDLTSHWRRKNWAAIVTNYSPTPFFKSLSEGLRDILAGGGQTALLPLDLALLRWAMGLLDITVPIRMSSDLAVGGESSERLVNICRAVGACTYLSGPGGRRYMDLGLFERAGLGVRFVEFEPKQYPQLFPKHGFIANLSVVDALFNCGPGARDLIGLGETSSP